MTAAEESQIIAETVVWARIVVMGLADPMAALIAIKVVQMVGIATMITTRLIASASKASPTNRVRSRDYNQYSR